MLQFLSLDTILHGPDLSKTQLRYCFKICCNLGSSVNAQIVRFIPPIKLAMTKTHPMTLLLSVQLQTVSMVIRSGIDKSWARILLKTFSRTNMVLTDSLIGKKSWGLFKASCKMTNFAVDQVVVVMTMFVCNLREGQSI